MSCVPINDSNVNPPPSSIPGFGISLPDLNIPLPNIPIDDLLALFNNLGFALPVGSLKPNLDSDLLNNVFQAVNDLLKKFMPFLMLYKFILPILNLILCIIEVLCAIPNPFKLIRAIRRLFRQCLPEFLSLFPFFALIIMIISLLLLILALIEYLILRILQLIERLLRNIIILGKASKRLDNDSIVAIVKKVGDLLCNLQNLFVIFGVILLIIQVIKAMLNLSFKIPPCDSSDGSSDGCCTPDVCPAFIKNNDDIIANTGSFLYYNAVVIDSGVIPFGVDPLATVIRNESWQFYDPNLAQDKQFLNIIKPFDAPSGVNTVFFPGGITYDKTASYSSTPYYISFRLLYNAAAFGKIDPKGVRYLQVKNAIVKAPPTVGVYNYDATFVAPFTGILNLVGGTITEDSGETILDSNGNPITLNDFFHVATNDSGITAASDAVAFSNITYTFTINHEALLGHALITLGCVPEVAFDTQFVNSTLGTQFNLNGTKLAGLTLPDMAVAQECILNNINTYRSNISVESTTQFQTNIVNCLNDLKNQTISALTAAVEAGFDQYKSDFSLDTSIQFTTQPIKVSVDLNESSGTSMTANLPATAAASLAAQISANISLGDISQFAYDGYQAFVADLTSPIPGNGVIKIAFNNNFISILTNPASIDQTPSVAIKSLNYTFVATTARSQEQGKPSRDDGDVSRQGSDRSGGE